jgi:hypothetical protein
MQKKGSGSTIKSWKIDPNEKFFIEAITKEQERWSDI